MLALLVALPFLVFGCTSTVTPLADPARPTTILVIRDALHVGVLLPDPTHTPPRYVEFGFGDWSYYALGQDAWYHVFATVLCPRRAR